MDKEKLKSIFWDYDVDYTADEIYDFIVERSATAAAKVRQTTIANSKNLRPQNKSSYIGIEGFNRDRLIARVLTSIRWYDLIAIFGIKQLYGFLNDDVLKFIWRKSIKDRYKNVREVLQGVL